MVDLVKGEKHKLLIGLTNLAADLPKMQQFSGHYVFLNDESVPEVQGFEITKIQLYHGVVAHAMYIEFVDVFFRQNCSHSILKDRKVELADSKKVPQFPSHHCNFNQDQTGSAWLYFTEDGIHMSLEMPPITLNGRSREVLLNFQTDLET